MISGPLSHNLGPGTSPVSINVGPKWLMISSPWSDDVKPLQLETAIITGMAYFLLFMW